MLGEGVDGVGDHRRPAGPDGREQVAVGHDAQPLVPGVVAGREVPVDVVAGRQPARRARRSSRFTRPGARRLSWKLTVASSTFFQRTTGYAACAGSRRRSASASRSRDGSADHVARRALQHGHVGGPLGHRRHQGDRGGAAADHHHPLAGVVEVLRPVLRVHQPSRERSQPGEVRGVALRRSGSSRSRRRGTSRSARRRWRRRCRPPGAHRPAGGGRCPTRRATTRWRKRIVPSTRTRRRSPGRSRGSRRRRRWPSAPVHGRNE